MKIRALVILEAAYVDFEIHDDATEEQIKELAVEISSQMSVTWKPTVEYSTPCVFECGAFLPSDDNKTCPNCGRSQNH